MKAAAEKPSMGRDIARVLGADKRCDGYCEGNGWQVTWAVGHLVEIHDPLAEGKWAETPLPLYSNFVLRPKKDADKNPCPCLQTPRFWRIWKQRART